MTIYFDMDGTIANLYGVENWLQMLEKEDITPYLKAAPMCNFSRLARKLNQLQHKGYKLGIISWTSKYSTDKFHTAVQTAKCQWLKKHLPSVSWDIIHIVKYGSNKWQICKEGILFDDEEKNRKEWLNGQAHEPTRLFDLLNTL